MSVWQSPEASILTTICSGPGSGLATSSIRSGVLNSCTTAAFNVFSPCSFQKDTPWYESSKISSSKTSSIFALFICLLYVVPKDELQIQDVVDKVRFS